MPSLSQHWSCLVRTVVVPGPRMGDVGQLLKDWGQLVSVTGLEFGQSGASRNLGCAGRGLLPFISARTYSYPSYGLISPWLDQSLSHSVSRYMVTIRPITRTSGSCRTPSSPLLLLQCGPLKRSDYTYNLPLRSFYICTCRDMGTWQAY